MMRQHPTVALVESRKFPPRSWSQPIREGVTRSYCTTTRPDGSVRRWAWAYRGMVLSGVTV